MQFIHGFHDEGGEHLHQGKPGWTMISEEVGLNVRAQGRDYRHIANQGIGVLIRINYSHMGQGTIPLPHEYEEFAAAVASFAATSHHVAYWIIGNEPNHEGERPGGVVIEPEDYARCFVLCRDAIKRAVPGAKVVPAAMAPYHAQPIPWADYLYRVLLYIEQHGGCDGINVHAYTRGMDAKNIFSTDTMGPPLEHTYSGFKTYQNALDLVPHSMKRLPAFITEFDAYGAWENRNTGVIRTAYTEIDLWNSQPHNWPKVVCLLCFRWNGQNHVDWKMYDKPELLRDFADAVEDGNRVPQWDNAPPAHPNNTWMPVVHNQGGNEPTVTTQMDPRLIERGVTVKRLAVRPGEYAWRLVGAKWFNRDESGGRHHIYIEAVDEDGRPFVGIPFTVKWGNEHKVVTSNGRSGFDAANYNMAANGKNSYSVGALNGDTVQGIGMGQDTPGGFNAGEHTSTLLTFKRTREPFSQPQQPAPQPQPSQPARVPLLAHPVAEPQYRRITQGWKERPDYYSRFKVDGVPLQGHNGLDFGTPTGSQIQAVDGGQVVEVADDPEGYGLYVKLRHSWGESLYAHLRTQMVGFGEPVNKGQIIGKSGNTGNSTGPHLHFGMRVNPFNRRDGMGGYSDPSPYLQNTGPSSPTNPQPQTTPDAVVAIIKAAAGEFGVDWRLLLSLIHAESSLDPAKVNTSSGAKGLGQIMPLTWGEWSARVGASNILDARDNARVTAAYLQWCLAYFQNHEWRGLYAYVWGARRLELAMIDGKTVPAEVVNYANKIIHGKEVLRWANP